MKLPRRKFLHLAAGAAAVPSVSRFAWAQAYPTRPVHLIVPFGPAGATDITARFIGQWFLALKTILKIKTVIRKEDCGVPEPSEFR